MLQSNYTPYVSRRASGPRPTYCIVVPYRVNTTRGLYLRTTNTGQDVGGEQTKLRSVACVHTHETCFQFPVYVLRRASASRHTGYNVQYRLVPNLSLMRLSLAQAWRLSLAHAQA